MSDIYKECGKADEAINRLIRITEILRRECPWDNSQTHESLRAGMIEEAYEVCDAIDRGNAENLEEELGDVLLQVVFHSILAEESSRFDFVSVINKECEKLIRRHPHVFLKENVKSIDKAMEKWENVKRKEQDGTLHSQRLKAIPQALPALIRSYKIQAKAAEAGFDWDDASGAFMKIEEETEELKQAYENGYSSGLFEEMGDLLFSVVNVARFLKVNPEQALNATSAKFIKRFTCIEEMVYEQGDGLEGKTLEEMDALWEEVKRREKQDSV